MIISAFLWEQNFTLEKSDGKKCFTSENANGRLHYLEVAISIYTIIKERKYWQIEEEKFSISTTGIWVWYPSLHFPSLVIRWSVRQ